MSERGTADDSGSELRAGAELEPCPGDGIDRFRAAFEHSAMAMALWAADGRLLHLNSSLCRVTGYSADELAGMTWRDLCHPEDAPPVRTMVRELLAGRRLSFQVTPRVRHRDGSWRWGRVTVSVVRGADGRPSTIVGQLEDITESKRAEDRLRESEERLRAIIEHSSNLFYSHTPDHVLTYASPQTRTILDCEPEEALVRWTEFATDSPVNQLGFESTQRAIDTGVAQPPYELELVGLQGRRVWVEVREAPVVESGRTVAIVGALVDITDRRRADEALRRSEERYRQVVEDQAEFIVRWRPDGTRTFVNEPYCRYFGRSEEELLGTSFFPLIAEPDRERVRAKIASLSPAQPARIDEHRVVRDDGSIVWQEWTDRGLFDATGELVELQSVGRDITPRKLAQQKLLESEKRYRQLFERNMAGVYRTTPDGLILDCNEAFARILGCGSPAEVLTRSAADFYPNAGARSEMLEALRSQGELHNHEISLRRTDGSEVVALANMSLVEDGAGGSVIEGTMIDITERMEIEDRLRQAVKMEAIGRLAGGVAHDFNNLLQAMTALTALLDGSQEPDERGDRIAELEELIRRGAQLTRQLLLFSRRQPIRRTRIDLNELITGTTGLLGRLLRENIELVVDLSPSPVVVGADRGQLEQVVVNLVVNASDAMPDGGRLTVRTLSGVPGEARLVVADTGHGIPEQVRHRLFEPFFTTKDPSQGTGLGLAVVHGIVAELGGSIEVESELAVGTTFTVALPAAGPSPDAATASPEDGPTGGSGRVLVVEDEPAVRESIRRIVQSLGYQVVGVGSAAEAAALPDRPAFDLVLTDFLLPDGSGTEVAQRLGRRWPQIRVIVMSGYAEDGLFGQQVRDGAWRFLQKPFTLHSLDQEIREAMSGPR